MGTLRAGRAGRVHGSGARKGSRRTSISGGESRRSKGAGVGTPQGCRSPPIHGDPYIPLLRPRFLAETAKHLLEVPSGKAHSNPHVLPLTLQQSSVFCACGPACLLRACITLRFPKEKR